MCRPYNIITFLCPEEAVTFSVHRLLSPVFQRSTYFTALLHDIRNRSLQNWFEKVFQFLKATAVLPGAYGVSCAIFGTLHRAKKEIKEVS